MNIYVINKAQSGSSIEEWHPATGSHFAPKMAFLEEGMKKGVVRGFIWHQGEANGGTSSVEYAMRLGAIVQASRDNVGNQSKGGEDGNAGAM